MRESRTVGLRASRSAGAKWAGASTPGGHFKERYSLERSHGIWLITGARQIP